MILHAVATPGLRTDLPCLVWLHGFLGSEREWADFHGAFADWPQLRIDLPGHGESADIRVSSFADVDKLLRKTLLSYNILNYWLIGYSLGGRIAMYHACQNSRLNINEASLFVSDTKPDISDVNRDTCVDHCPQTGPNVSKTSSTRLCGLVVEGGNPGLSDRLERQQRVLADQRWARRLREQPIADVLTSWYQQPVFSSLNDAQRRELVALRSRNNPQTLAAMLEATSLGVQPDLQHDLRQLSVPFHYICGERDNKFRALAEGLMLSPHLIPAAGHNAHRENPAAFCAVLLTLLRQPIEETP